MAISADDTVNPIKVTGTTATAAAVTTKNVYVKFIRWYKPTTAGHLLSLTNTAGAQLTSANCILADQSEDIPVFKWTKGIKIDDMDSGTVYIFCDEKYVG